MTITVNDTYVHLTSLEVLQKIFGYSDKVFRHGFRLPKNNNYVIWFPKLSISVKQRPQCDWSNLLNATGTELVVEWVGDPARRSAAETNACQYANRLQVVFGARMGYAGYEFLGIFKCKKGVDGGWCQKDGKRHYERVDTSVDVDIVINQQKVGAKKKKTVTAPKIIASALEKLGTKYNGLPTLFTKSIVPVRSCNRSNVNKYKIGEASFLIEYAATLSAKAPILKDREFDAFHSYDIDRLSQGRCVRYYLNKNIGYRSWEKFIEIIRGLESFRGEFLSEADEMLLRGERV